MPTSIAIIGAGIAGAFSEGGRRYARYRGNRRRGCGVGPGGTGPDFELYKVVDNSSPLDLVRFMARELEL